MKLENIKLMIAIFFVGTVFGWTLPGLIQYNQSSNVNLNQKNIFQNNQNPFKNDIESLKNKENEEFDRAFISMMISKNQEAITISQLANQNTENQNLKDLAKKGVEQRVEEIRILNNWRLNGIQ